MIINKIRSLFYSKETKKVDELFLEYKSRHRNYIDNLNKILEEYNKNGELKYVLDWIKFEF